jgi:hypothetical protein
MRDASLTLAAWDKAVERFEGKVSVGSVFRTADWAAVPLGIRDRSYFLAAVSAAKDLQTVRSGLTKALHGFDPDRRRPDGSFMTYSAQDAIADIRRDLGVVGDSGQLTDLGSYRRQKLIQDFQAEQAYSYARWKRDLEDPEILDEFPAQEFVRVEPRRRPRATWWERWGEAGARVGWVGAIGWRMVALKTSPIWEALSRFGTPYPPFDFGSGMGLRDVGHEDAARLGLIPPDWDPAKAGKDAQEGFNDRVEASVRDLDPDTRQWLERALDGVGRIIGEQAVMDPPPPPHGGATPTGESISGKFQLAAAGRHALPKTTQVQITGALAAVDRVHGDGPLQPSPVDRRVPKKTLGVYSPLLDRIGVRPGPDAALTFLHELGHRLDFKGIAVGGPMKSAAQYGGAAAMDKLMRTIDASQAVQNLRKLPLRPMDAMYLLSPVEKFARAYSQFTAVEGKYSPAVRTLDKIVAGQTKHLKDTQWTQEDFAPIRSAFLGLFQSLNWINKP